MPGADLLAALREQFPQLPLFAEDLGTITPEVRALRDEFGLPGMLVLQFAFDGMPDNPYLPDNHVEQAVVYTGTHDNDTTVGWYESLDDGMRDAVHTTLNDASPMPDACICGAGVAGTAGRHADAGSAGPRRGQQNERTGHDRGQLALAFRLEGRAGRFRRPVAGRAHGTRPLTREFRSVRRSPTARDGAIQRVVLGRAMRPGEIFGHAVATILPQVSGSVVPVERRRQPPAQSARVRVLEDTAIAGTGSGSKCRIESASPPVLRTTGTVP